MSILEQARAMRKCIVEGAESLDDKTVSTAPEMLGRLKNSGELIQAGTRINWHGTVKRAATDLWDRVENNPDNTPTLWEDIGYKDGYRYIPEVITAGLAFALDECGWWTDGLLYRSKIAANVYTPEQYSEGWELVE